MVDQLVSSPLVLHLLALVCRFNTFHLEASSSCRYDYVAVHDGHDSLAPLLGKFCGDVLPPKLLSSTNHMFLVFRTDASVSGDGWRATYSQTLGGYPASSAAVSGGGGITDPTSTGSVRPSFCLSSTCSSRLYF